MAKIASVAMSISCDNKQENLSSMITYIEEAATQDADLILFPEMALTGFPKNPMSTFSPDDAAYQHQVAELIPEGDSTQTLIALAKKYDMYIAWGMSEQSSSRADVLYNAVVLVGPEGFIGKYRKVHQPLTERILFYSGEGDYPVFDTRIGKVGLMVCFDKSYPEVSRILALKGAEVILCPQLWPTMERDGKDSDFLAGNIFSYARAFENMVFFVDSGAAGPYFMGHSRIVGPNPMQVCATTEFEPGMAIADVDIQGEILKSRLYAMAGSDLLKDRKPATYGLINKPNKYNPMSGDIGQLEE